MAPLKTESPINPRRVGSGVVLAPLVIRSRKRPAENDYPSVLARKHETCLQSESFALFSNAAHLWYWQRRSFVCVLRSSPHETSSQYRQSSLKRKSLLWEVTEQPCDCIYWIQEFGGVCNNFPLSILPHVLPDVEEARYLTTQSLNHVQ